MYIYEEQKKTEKKNNTSLYKHEFQIECGYFFACPQM